MKKFLSLLVFITSLTFVSCENEPLDSTLLNQQIETPVNTNILPILTTTSLTNITTTTAKSGGTVTSEGSSAVTTRGVVWSTSQNPTIANSKTVSGSGIGNFVSSISNLIANTTYYVRAYATNDSGTAYGNQQTFTTTSIFGTYDLTHIKGPATASVDLNNDGITSTNFLDEQPTAYFNDDKIVLNNNGTFTYVGTDTNQVGNILYYNDYTLTGNWSINSNLITLTVTSNGPSYVMGEYILSGNTLSERWPAGDTYTYVNGILTTVYLDYIDYIYTKQ